MISFPDAASRELLAELREASLVTPAVTEAIRAALHHAESFTLEEFLLAGAEILDERAWLTWLIRRKECYRFGPVRLSALAATWPPAFARDLPLPANLPYERTAAGTALIAVLRPDQPAPGYRAAATLRELRELREAWRRVT